MKILNKKVANGELRGIMCSQAIEECAKNTEGYCLQDLADLVDKATLAACMRQGRITSSSHQFVTVPALFYHT